MVDILEKFLNKDSLLMTDRLLRQLSKVKASDFVKNKELRMPSKHYIKTYFMSYRRDPLVTEENASEEGLDELLSSLEKQEPTNNVKAKISLIKGTQSFLKGDTANAFLELSPIPEMEDIDKDVVVNTLIKLGAMSVQKNAFSGDELKDAFVYFDKAIEIDPNNQDIYIHRAQVECSSLSEPLFHSQYFSTDLSY